MPKFDSKGRWVNKEMVELPEDIGVWVNGETGEQQKTNRGIIHYGKKGTHLVPARGEK